MALWLLRAHLAGLESLSCLAAGVGRFCRLQFESLAHALSLVADHRTLTTLASVSPQRALSDNRYHPPPTEPRGAALVRPDHAGRFRVDGIVSRVGLAVSNADAGAQ